MSIDVTCTSIHPVEQDKTKGPVVSINVTCYKHTPLRVSYQVLKYSTVYTHTIVLYINGHFQIRKHMVKTEIGTGLQDSTGLFNSINTVVTKITKVLSKRLPFHHNWHLQYALTFVYVLLWFFLLDIVSQPFTKHKCISFYNTHLDIHLATLVLIIHTVS